MTLERSKKLYYFLLPFLLAFIVFSFFRSINIISHIYDSMHHGLIFSNGVDLLEGKKPYKEIFIQYGLLGTVLNSIFIYLSNFNIVSIYYATSSFYFLSIIILSLTTKSLSNYFYMFLTCIIFLFNHPMPHFPWPNYLAFFFLTLGVYFFSEHNYKKLFLSGFCLSCSFLVRENFYYFIIPSFLIINFLLFIFHKDLKRIYFLISGFLLPVIIFLIYLISNDLFQDWLFYQTLPFEYLKSHGNSFFYLLREFIIFFSTQAIFNIVNNPQYIIILIIFLFNIFVLFEEIFFNKDKNLKVILICIICLSSSIVSINYEIFRLYTSVIIGLPILFYRIYKTNNSQNNFITCFILLFISIYSFIYFPKGNVKFFQKIDFINSYTSKEFQYFRSQKWPKEKWNNLIMINKMDSLVKNNCKIEYVANFTPDIFFYLISDLKKIQIFPLIVNNMKNFETFVQKNLYAQIGDEMKKSNIYIFSMENNINKVKKNLDNYVEIYSLEVKDMKGTSMRIWVPKKCYQKLQLNNLL